MGHHARAAAGGSRFALVKGICLLVACVLSARLVQVQVIDHQAYREAADRQWLQAKTIKPRRGDLYDRHGRPLAITVASCRVGVAGSLITDRQALCADLARYVREHPTLHEPATRATTHGRLLSRGSRRCSVTS